MKWKTKGTNETGNQIHEHQYIEIFFLLTEKDTSGIRLESPSCQ
jgi:hypothetical protein